MKVYPIPGKGYGSNSYILRSEKTALVDAGTEAGNIIKETSKLNTEIDYLILTHCHFDHIAAASELVDEYNPEIMAHELAATRMEKADSRHILSGLFNAECPEIKIDVRLWHGDPIELGDVKLEVIHTPGHSEGSICLYERDSGFLFTGDVVFKDGVGRSDLPGGGWDELEKSLKKLHELYLTEGVKKIFPGHGLLGEGRDIEKNYLMFFAQD